jgi:hypothetical protein
MLLSREVMLFASKAIFISFGYSRLMLDKLTGGGNAKRFLADNSGLQGMGCSGADDGTASDFPMLDVMRIGGGSGWLRAATLAYTKGMLVSKHLWPEISARRQRIGWSMLSGGIPSWPSRYELKKD